MTCLIGIAQLGDEVSFGVLEGGYLIAGEGFDEVGASEASDFGGFSLGDLLHFVPFDGGGDPHFLGKFFGGFAKGRECGVWEVEGDASHVFLGDCEG
jgi:hypothetical protein